MQNARGLVDLTTRVFASGECSIQINIDAKGRAPKRIERGPVGTSVRIRVLRGEVPHLDVQFRLGLPASDAGLKATKHLEPDAAALFDLIATIRKRNPQVGPQPGLAALKIRRRHSCDYA